MAIEVIQRIKKNALILSQISAEQSKYELTKWTIIYTNKIIVLSNKFKKINPKK